MHTKYEIGSAPHFPPPKKGTVCPEGNRGTLLVAQLVEALRYKPESSGFDFG